MVQPLLVYRAREGEDLTFDKSDPKDAVIIARLALLRARAHAFGRRSRSSLRCRPWPAPHVAAEAPSVQTHSLWTVTPQVSSRSARVCGRSGSERDRMRRGLIRRRPERAATQSWCKTEA